MIRTVSATLMLAALTLAGCGASVPGLPSNLQAAAANYPPMVITGNVHTTDGHEVPRACAPAGTSVVNKGGPTLRFNGADPSDPDLCLFTADGQPLKGYYDIWLLDWPGYEQAHATLRQVMTGPSGTVAGFDTKVAEGREYHDLIRNEGVEDIYILDKTYRALKISHYREGFKGNNYRSVATVWKDVPSGVLVYATYQHISGQPVIDDPLIPVAVTTN